LAAGSCAVGYNSFGWSFNVRYALVAAFWLAGLLCHGASDTPKPGKQVPPKLMLWSWFAEDDFRPLANRDIGVAYLALSLQLEGQTGVTPSPRAEAVRIPPDAYTMAVIRIDYSSDSNRRPSFSPKQREMAVRMVAEIAALAKPQAIQIDFDAPRSAWPFYRQLLADIRNRLGPNVFLSITALVSWCDNTSSWLSDLPVDEVVPMAFSMGQATPATLTMLQMGSQFPFPGCRASIGVEVPIGLTVLTVPRYDSRVRPQKGQRAYFFLGAQKWSPELVSWAQKGSLP
jgi:hypothetical protein